MLCDLRWCLAALALVVRVEALTVEGWGQGQEEERFGVRF